MEFSGVLRFHKNFKFFPRQKIFFFEFENFCHNFFSKNVSTFFRNLKNIGIFSNKKIENFLNSKFEFKKFSIFLFLKIPIFFRFRKNVGFFFRKKCAKKIWTRKKIIFCRWKILKFLWNHRIPENPVNLNFQHNPISCGGWGKVSGRGSAKSNRSGGCLEWWRWACWLPKSLSAARRLEGWGGRISWARQLSLRGNSRSPPQLRNPERAVWGWCCRHQWTCK